MGRTKKLSIGSLPFAGLKIIRCKRYGAQSDIITHTLIQS